jgi:hypothetical protein
MSDGIDDRGGLIMTSSVAERSSQLAAAVGLAGGIQTLRRAAAKLRALITSTLMDPYRPELHYMRGPGPKWRERRAATRRG